MSDHPTPQELKAFAGNRLRPRSRRTRVLAHLLQCRDCMLQVAGPPASFHAGAAADAGPVEVPQALDRAVDRTCRRVAAAHERIRRERERAAPLIADILAGRRDPNRLEPPERALLAGLPTVELWTELARRQRYEDPAAMVAAARVARLAADALDGRRYGRAFVQDRRALAMAELANAYRVADDLHRAGAILGSAKQRFQRGSRSPRIEVRLVEIEASLACDGRRFAEADRLIDRAVRLYRSLGDRHLAGRALVTKSHFAACRNDPAAALGFLEEGAALLDPAQDPELVKTVVQNRIVYLADTGDLKRAQRLLWEARADGQLPDGALNRIRLRAVEGAIHAGLGRLDRAELAFADAVEGYEEHGLPIQMGIAGLDLAAVWLQAGKAHRVVPLARALAQSFERLEVHREALAAVLLVEDAHREGRLTPKYLWALRQILRNLDHGPRPGGGSRPPRSG